MKEDALYLIDRLLFLLDGEEIENQGMLINLIARTKELRRMVVKYL